MRSALLLLVAISSQSVPGRSADLRLSVHQIDPGASETAAVTDVDRDGRLDIISGAYWYKAPDWTPYRFRELGGQNNYLDSFSVMPVDVDDDGWMDIADVSWFAKRIAWWRNPGGAGGSSLWEEHVVNACCNVEFAVLADIDGDGEAREIVAQENGTGQAWYEPSAGRWTRHQISARSYGHGIGAGDVNGDGRTDVLTPAGWLEAPVDPRGGGDWTLHEAWADANRPVPPAGTAPVAPGAQPEAADDQRRVQLGFMHVVDVNGDGRNDVLTAAGHDYGVFWFEQGAEGWTRRVVDSAWSQGHASALADINGDGRLDFVTGKRFMAHNGSDPGGREPQGLYWYEWWPVPTASGSTRVEWSRHVLSYGGQVGSGMQIVVADLDGDQDADIIVGGKSGLHWLESGRR